MQLAQYLEITGLKDEQFAQLIGLHRVSVLRYRLKQEIPSAETIKKIVKVTAGRVTANDLLQIFPEPAE